MTLIIKAFATNGATISNQPGNVSTIGELSPMSATYTKNPGFYTNQNFPNLELVTFLSNNGDAAIALPNDFIGHALDVSSRVYGIGTSGVAPQTPGDWANQILNLYQNVITDVSAGQMVTQNAITVPEWVQWTFKNGSIANNVIKVWFSDPAFAVEYDEGSVVIIPPIANIDTFFSNDITVKNALAAVSDTDRMGRIQDAKAGYPETFLGSNIYSWYNFAGSNQPVPVAWAYLVYGQASNNIDAIRDAIVAYIQANSTHSLADWKKIFPDIFKRTECVFRPMWENIGIPQRATNTGIYSPFVSPAQAIAALKTATPFYPAAQADNNGKLMAHLYKSLQVAFTPGPDNRVGAETLEKVFPDYINVSTSSPDSMRMSANTMAFAIAMEKLLVYAETVTQFTGIPDRNYTKVIRNGNLYVVGTVANVNLLVYAKSNIK